MAQRTLVVGPTALPNAVLEGGVRLVRLLIAGGVDLRGAAWAAVADDGRPYLYLITPDVEDRDPRPTYAKVRAALDIGEHEGYRWPEEIADFGVKLIPPNRPLALSVMGIYRRHPDNQPTWHYESGLGSGAVDGAYIYPAALFRPAPVT